MRKFDYRDREGFQETITNQIPNLLDDAVDWIRKKCDPEDIFDTEVLEQWAEEHDYNKE